MKISRKKRKFDQMVGMFGPVAQTNLESGFGEVNDSHLEGNKLFDDNNILITPNSVLNSRQN